MSRYAFIAAASLFALASSARAAVTTLYATDFENFDTNSSLDENDDFIVLNGTATVTGGTTATTTHSGVQSVRLSVGATTNYAFKITPVTDFTTQPIIQAQASVLIASPASGTANRGVLGGFGVFNSDGLEIADETIFWDAENSFGGGANHVYLQTSFYADPDADVDGNVFDFGVVTSAQLTNFGYFNLGIALDYSTGSINFFESGQYITNGQFDPAAFGDFSDADLFTQRLTTTAGGVLPRIFADDYSIQQSDALTLPEPTTLLASAGLVAGVGARRRRA